MSPVLIAEARRAWQDDLAQREAEGKEDGRRQLANASLFMTNFLASRGEEEWTAEAMLGYSGRPGALPESFFLVRTNRPGQTSGERRLILKCLKTPNAASMPCNYCNSVANQPSTRFMSCENYYGNDDNDDDDNDGDDSD